MVDSGPESSNSSVGKVASGGLLAYLRSGVRVVVLVALLGVKKLGKRRRIVRALLQSCAGVLRLGWWPTRRQAVENGSFDRRMGI